MVTLLQASTTRHAPAGSRSLSARRFSERARVRLVVRPADRRRHHRAVSTGQGVGVSLSSGPR